MRGFVIIFRFKEYINLYIFINGFFMLSKKIIKNLMLSWFYKLIRINELEF